MLVCNASELREALTNVVFNAVDALPEGGLITLATRSVFWPDTQAGGSAAQELQIEVRDNGLGMEEKGPSTLPGTVFFPPNSPPAAPAWGWRWFMEWSNGHDGGIGLRAR